MSTPATAGSAAQSARSTTRFQASSAEERQVGEARREQREHEHQGARFGSSPNYTALINPAASTIKATCTAPPASEKTLVPPRDHDARSEASGEPREQLCDRRRAPEQRRHARAGHDDPQCERHARTAHPAGELRRAQRHQRENASTTPHANHPQASASGVFIDKHDDADKQHGRAHAAQQRPRLARAPSGRRAARRARPTGSSRARRACARRWARPARRAAPSARTGIRARRRNHQRSRSAGPRMPLARAAAPHAREQQPAQHGRQQDREQQLLGCGHRARSAPLALAAALDAFEADRDQHLVAESHRACT